MQNTTANLRKAAVLLRSVDADTAATLLAQLSHSEAVAVRDAIRSLGPIDSEEQTEVLAEFRRTSPLTAGSPAQGVELQLSSSPHNHATQNINSPASTATGKRFEFLDNAPTSAIAPYLAREHAQTVAVVLSHLAPARAAEVLAALPAKLQADAIERLSFLGDTDAEIISVLETELAAWVNKRTHDRNGRPRRADAVASILSAADEKSRDRILNSLKSQNAALADQLAPLRRAMSDMKSDVQKPNDRVASLKRALRPNQLRPTTPRPQPPALSLRPLPHFDFHDLNRLDDRIFASVLKATDAKILTLALAGSSDELVDRICEHMPKRTANAFRRELRRIGPTRLSDVEAAQRAVAQVAAQQLAQRRQRLLPAAG